MSRLSPAISSNFLGMIRNSQGGIRPSIGMHGMPAEKQDRYERLKKEFEEIDVNQDNQLTFEEVYNFLNRRSDGDFNVDLCRQLFQKMDKNQDMQITKEEFLTSYIDAESKLQDTIRELQRYIANQTKQMDDFRRQMIEARANQKLNRYGIMEDSTLTVNVVEAQNLKPMDAGTTSDPYVILSCEGQRIQTEVIYNDLNPVWNEVFTFKILKGEGDLKVIVMDKDNFVKDDFEGQLSIPLSELSDQMKHDQFYDLYGSNPREPWQGRIHLALQWIWNKDKFLQDIVSQYEGMIKKANDDLRKVQSQLMALDKPFSAIAGNDIQMYIQTPIDPYETTQKKTFKSATTAASTMMTSRLESIENNFVRNLDSYAEQKIGVKLQWDQVSFVVVSVFLLISTFSMFARPDFLSISLASGALYFLFTNNTKYWTKKVLQGVTFSLAVDFIWMALYTGSWGSGEDEADGLGNGIRRFSLAMSMLNFLVKIIVILTYWRNLLN